MLELFQIAGAVLVLIAFGLAQAGRLNPASRSYLVLNLSGAVILSINAAIARQPGFVLLNVVWAAVAAWSLVRGIRRTVE